MYYTTILRFLVPVRSLFQRFNLDPKIEETFVKFSKLVFDKAMKERSDKTLAA
ncbi:MAG: hypothetical protein ABIA04_08440 [Pseudomonadota bacterium]